MLDDEAPPRSVRTAGSLQVLDGNWLYLPGTPWSMRLACGSADRPALEIYAAGSLIDVVVASSLASRLLRGACKAVIGRQARAIAWGCLPTTRGKAPSVEFMSGIRRRGHVQQAETVADWFWFADAGGRFSKVMVTSQAVRASCRTRWAAAAW